jgi:hypothetical protein
MDPKAQSSFMSHQQLRESNTCRLLIADFFKSFSVPQRTRDTYFKAKDVAVDVDREAAFNACFPDLPFYVCLMPIPKSKEFTTLHSLEGTRGGDLARMYLNNVTRVFNTAAGRSVVALFKLPYMDGAYCMHAMDRDVVDPYDFPGGVYSNASEKGGRFFIQGLDNFAKHEFIRTMVKRVLG